MFFFYLIRALMADPYDFAGAPGGLRWREGGRSRAASSATGRVRLPPNPDFGLTVHVHPTRDSGQP